MKPSRTEILDLSRVRVRRRCPKCGLVSTKRSATAQGSGELMNGATLWDLLEWCTMCGWRRAYTNVQIGA